MSDFSPERLVSSEKSPYHKVTNLCKRCVHYWQVLPDENLHSELIQKGAGSGIGRAVALRLVADGVKNIALIDLTEDHLADVEAKIAELDASVKVLKIGADCGKEEQVESAVEKTVSNFGRLDACFNGAGIGGSAAKTADMNSVNLDTVLGVNLKGVWYCERAQVSIGENHLPSF